MTEGNVRDIIRKVENEDNKGCVIVPVMFIVFGLIMWTAHDVANRIKQLEQDVKELRAQSNKGKS